MAEGFTCDVHEKYRFACQGLDSYGEHEGKRYCVLHYPGEEKNKEEFLKVKKSKLAREDYDFGGTVFPEGTSDFKWFEFVADADFAGATFVGKANFWGAQFSGEKTVFSEVQFSGRTDFSYAKFSGGTNFRRAEFSGGTHFFSAEFSGEKTDFSYAKFSGEETVFSGAQFSGEKTNFFSAEFRGEWTAFEKARFFNGSFSGGRGWTDFSSAKFSGEKTDFSGAEFFSGGRGWTDFRRAEFSGEKTGSSYGAGVANFRRVFSEANSSGVTNFSGAQFSGKETVFSGAQFSGGTNFRRAEFSAERTVFSDAEFSGEMTDFSGAQFSGAQTDFQEATFVKEVAFTGATFSEKVAFWGSKANPVFGYGAWAWFNRCRIEKPEQFTFDTVLLHPCGFINTDVRRVDFTDVKWYGMPGGPEGTLDEEISALEARAKVESPHTLLSQACQRLAANAEENRAYPLANDFYHWSMEALRKAGWRSLGLIRTIYWLLSGYGVKPGHAFGVLFMIWVVFAGLYVLVPSSEFYAFSTSNSGPVISDIGQAMVYSLGSMARLNPEPKPDPSWFQLLVTVEGLLGPLQIGLLILAIRRKVMR